MLVASSGTQQANIAWQARKTQAPFFCPSCKEEVILRKGKIRAHHFAHKPPVTCIYGRGESQKHYQVKTQIYKLLGNSPNCFQCELEKPLKGVRPDISALIDNMPVAIEVQKSNIDIDTIIKRATRYSQLGYALLWVMPDAFPCNASIENDPIESRLPVSVCRPREWQKFIHAMYFGRLYYWQAADTNLLPIHLGQFRYYVEENNWVDNFYGDIGENLEGTDWHEEHYDNAWTGGYWKISKTKKQVIRNSKIDGLDIAKDFRIQTRRAWAAKNWEIPACNLWIDKSRKWWD